MPYSIEIKKYFFSAVDFMIGFMGRFREPKARMREIYRSKHGRDELLFAAVWSPTQRHQNHAPTKLFFSQTLKKYKFYLFFYLVNISGYCLFTTLPD